MATKRLRDYRVAARITDIEGKMLEELAKQLDLKVSQVISLAIKELYNERHLKK